MIQRRERPPVDAYCHYQIEHENEVLAPGVAFPLVNKLLGLNQLEPKRQRVEVVLISRNSADTGLRVFNSIQHYDLKITRAAFTGGLDPYRYVQPFNAQLFLSADPLDVSKALAAGFASATILPSTPRCAQIVCRHLALHVRHRPCCFVFSCRSKDSMVW